MFLANENFPKPSILFLRNHGFQVLSVQESAAGISDREVVQKAIALNLIILTFDRDYGELIFRYAQQTPPAVVYFREKGAAPEFAGSLLVRLLQTEGVELANAFSVVDAKRFETTVLP